MDESGKLGRIRDKLGTQALEVRTALIRCPPLSFLNTQTNSSFQLFFQLFCLSKLPPEAITLSSDSESDFGKVQSTLVDSSHVTKSSHSSSRKATINILNYYRIYGKQISCFSNISNISHDEKYYCFKISQLNFNKKDRKVC